jgi:hypothetical protein
MAFRIIGEFESQGRWAFQFPLFVDLGDGNGALTVMDEMRRVARSIVRKALGPRIRSFPSPEDVKLGEFFPLTAELDVFISLAAGPGPEEPEQ